MTFFQERELLLKYIRRGCEDGLIRLSAGNFSTRFSDDLAAITPSGILYQTMSIDDISIVDMDGNSVSGPPPLLKHQCVWQSIEMLLEFQASAIPIPYMLWFVLCWVMRSLS